MAGVNTRMPDMYSEKGMWRKEIFHPVKCAVAQPLQRTPTCLSAARLKTAGYDDTAATGLSMRRKRCDASCPLLLTQRSHTSKLLHNYTATGKLEINIP